MLLTNYTNDKDDNDDIIDELERQEKELKEEGRQILTLQDSLQQSSQLCNDMIKQLEQFETNFTAIEPTIMPLYRNLSIIARVHTNIEATLNVVKLLSDMNELAKREEYLISAGPTKENIDGYIDSIQRVQDGIRELHEANLSFCQITIRRLESINGIALDELSNRFKDWLNAACNNCVDGDLTSMTSDVSRPLGQISTFASSLDGGMMSDVLGYYAQVRATFLMNALQKHFKEIDSITKGTYQRGTHPFIMAIKAFFGMSARESACAAQVLPEQHVNDAVKRTMKHPADVVKMSSEAVANKVEKATVKGEFVDQIWIFDIIETFNDCYASCTNGLIQELVKSALKAVTAGGIEFLKELMDHIQDPNKSTAASSNATVFEQTSILLNCLKRMLEYESITEALLNKWSQKEWDGIVGPIASSDKVQLFAMALYYQDLLKGLEVSIEGHSRIYKKAIMAVLFQLNNYNYILKTFKSSNLATMVTIESEQKYESIVESLLHDYLEGWKYVASLLVEGSPRITTMTSKERLKTFSAEFEELVKLQENCAVPDTDLRRTLMSEIQTIITAPFISFYNLNQPLFISVQAKIKLDPAAIEFMISRLFQA